MDSKVVLGVDTSTSTLSLALASIEDDGSWNMVKSVTVENQGRHSETLAHQVSEFLERHSLARIVWGRGPGSYTGLRIGASFLAGFALSKGVPLVGIPTFFGIAQGSSGTHVLVMRDARAEEKYYQWFQRRELQGEIFFTPCSNISVASLSRIQDECEHLGESDTCIHVIHDGSCEHFSVDSCYEIRKEADVARGLLHFAASATLSHFVPPTSSYQPLYVRPLAAQTIAERNAEKRRR
jgi:tRNA threonylcarbamoyl adenosine modification protein YeaZ